MSQTHPRRFGLRTLFAVIVIVAIPCAWAGYSLNWIRQRRDVLDNYDGYVTTCGTDGTGYQPDAPGWLWLFGERGIAVIVRQTKDPEETERLQRLFPESRIEDQ